MVEQTSSSLKRLSRRIASLLPADFRRLLRCRYYLRVVRKYPESDWEWSPSIQPLVPSGGLVIDVGANVGYLSGLFARWVGPSGQVLSVEPIPTTFNALSYSMQKLYPTTVKVMQVCISDREGEVTMSVPDYEEGGANYYESRVVDSSTPIAPNQVAVPSTTLGLLIGDRNPDFIKIDVEGHELAVIRGGAEYLSRYLPPLLIEVAGDPDEEGSKAADLFALLSSWGYTPYCIKNNKLRKREKGDASVDYLFIRLQTTDHGLQT